MQKSLRISGGLMEGHRAILEQNYNISSQKHYCVYACNINDRELLQEYYKSLSTPNVQIFMILSSIPLESLCLLVICKSGNRQFG